MEARDFYNKRIKEDSTISSVQLMEEYAKIYGEIYYRNKFLRWHFI